MKELAITNPIVIKDTEWLKAIEGYKGAINEYPIANKALIKHNKNCSKFICLNNYFFIIIIIFKFNYYFYSF